MPYICITETNNTYKLSVTPLYQNDIRSFLLMLATEQAFASKSYQIKCVSQGNVAVTFTFGAPCSGKDNNQDRTGFSERHATFNAALLEHMKKHGWRWLNYSRSDTTDNPIAEWTFEKTNCRVEETSTKISLQSPDLQLF